MEKKKEYNEHEEFWEVTFHLPTKKLKKYDNVQENLASEIMKHFDACNIKVIPCVVRRDNPHLEVSKDDYSYTTWNSVNLKNLQDKQSYD